MNRNLIYPLLAKNLSKIMNNEALAIKIAEDFLNSRDLNGWSYTIIHAKLRNNELSEWAIVIQYSKEGAVLGSPAVLIVNIENNSCRFMSNNG